MFPQKVHNGRNYAHAQVYKFKIQQNYRNVLWTVFKGQ